ncbi:receptor-like protein EIX2 [Vicia villosa]|uniref:receptor-like protein EIX2 n=1 Tax=Vicia villosa TaxID=3911 RepID=UPI00273AA1CC|nr:receptor-like protein EIX2 [Vicia villosa]
MKIILSILKLFGAIFVVVLQLFVNGAVGCLDNERHALLQLKASLTLDDDTFLLSSWDSKSDDCCAWEGISCNNQTGHVEMFHLSPPRFGYFPGEINASLMELSHLKYLNISGNQVLDNIFSELSGSFTNLRFLDLRASFGGGRIPNDLARLSELKYLDLSYNNLHGTIPHQLGNLSHLQHLDLSSNFGLAGTIPHQLGNLSHLQYLDLSSNDLVGTIPHQLGNLSHLQYLDLSANDLVGTISHQFGRLSNLQELHLGDNRRLNVGGEWLSNLTLLTHLDLSGMPNLNSSHVWLQMIAKLPKIQELKLSGCALSDLYLHSLFRSLFNFSTSLAILDLSHNAFSSSKIFEWVFNATSNLIDLDLSSNNFNDTITYEFGNMKNPLEHLDLSSNELQAGIPEFIRHMCMLQSLHLDGSNLNEDISTILHKLSGCARYSLQHLSLRDNQITGTFLNLSIFPSLITIDLSNNMLSGKVPDEIPKSLESLIFQSNSLEGGIPKSFGNLCSLRSLDLTGNKLSEDLSVILHNLSFGCAKDSLQELNMESNQIIGTVPDMSMFSSLRTLILSNNSLNGRILKKSTFPYHLESLRLDFNNLKGVITDSHFGNMSMLKELYLNDNSLSVIFRENRVPAFQLTTVVLRSCMLGPSFPKWFQSQKCLQKLDISKAGISDAVPVWFWTQTKYLYFMNISYNNLIGTIPNLPIRFSEGCQVFMDSNQFEGSIPSFFKSAQLLGLSENKFSETSLFLCANTTSDGLHMLDLSKNQLSGQLPDCWSHLNSLLFLDLSDNTLSGEVPSSMGSLLELQALILRNNSFTGEFPFSLKNCTRLFMLDAGNNKFSGPIPYWLGQQLRMLSLRRNQFYGTLPRSFCYLTNIQLLDLSENNLSGRIFKCIKNFSAMSQNVSSTTSDIPAYISYTVAGSATYLDIDLNAWLMWKGVERQFKNNEFILRSIDLSSNHLTGNIPEEIGILIGLESLNLSRNHLTGEITSEIGRLTSLEFLDLSRNYFYGLIPPSLAQIDRLSMLNLSDNNLSGRIPIGTQLQSFDASSYEGNVDLCGKPLDSNCPGDEKVTPQKPETNEESSPEDKKPIYLSVALGFITGFWGLWGSLFLIRTWRHTYVLFLNHIVDTMYVTMVLNGIKFQRWLRGLQEKFF